MSALRKLAAHSLLRFLFIGGALAVVYAVLTALLTALSDLPRPLIAVLVWLALIGPGFWCQRRFTFRGGATHRHGMLLYAGCQLIGMGIAAVGAWLFAQRSFWPDLVLFLCVSGLSAMISYLVSRLVIFPGGKA